MNLFGRILTGEQVEDAVVATLQLWMETYLAEVERQTSRPLRSLPLPRSYQVAQEFMKWPEEIIPAVVVVSPGTDGDPVMRGDGRYEATWTVGVAIVVAAATRNDTHSLAMAYSAAVRAALTQRPSLGGFAAGTTWGGESYDDLPSEDARSLQAGYQIFNVTVEDVMNARGGPPAAVPAVDPYVDPGDWPEVSADPDKRTSTVIKEEIT